MKILSVIVGLALTCGGVYLAYDTFMLFDEMESLRLILSLVGAFLAMTIGLYLFLLPLAMKPKRKKNKDIVKEALSVEEQDAIIRDTDAMQVILTENDVHEIAIEETNETPLELVEEMMETEALVHDEDDLSHTKAFDALKDENLNPPRHEEIDQTRVMDTLNDGLDGDTIVMPTFAEEKSDNSQTDDRLFTARIFNDTLDFETMHELRVIGIDSFGSQRILKKLQPDSELNLSYKQKKGLNLAQVSYKDKVIGYVSRLEMNHLNKSLDQLLRVTPGDIITDGRKVVNFSIQLHFQDDPKQK